MLRLFFVLATMAVQPVEPGLAGNWRNPRGSVIISIAPCAEALCGRVQWASNEATSDARKGGTDPLIGVELLRDFVPRGNGRWKGQVFLPDLNKISKAELRQLGPNEVKVTGCAVGRIICKSQVWTRAAAN